MRLIYNDYGVGKLNGFQIGDYIFSVYYTINQDHPKTFQFTYAKRVGAHSYDVVYSKRLDL